jgi:hypothetical protein
LITDGIKGIDYRYREVWNGKACTIFKGYCAKFNDILALLGILNCPL